MHHTGADMNARDKAIHELNHAGYAFERHGRKHDFYKNRETGVGIPLKRHDFDEDDLRYIRKEIRQNGRR